MSLFLSSWVGAACINPFIAKGSSPSCIQFPWGMKGHFILLLRWSENSLLQLVQWLLASIFPSDYLCVSDLTCLHVWLRYRCVGLAPSSSHRKLFSWGASDQNQHNLWARHCLLWQPGAMKGLWSSSALFVSSLRFSVPAQAITTLVSTHTQQILTSGVFKD